MPLSVDCTVGLESDLGILPIMRLITCALRRSIRQLFAACMGGGLLVYVFGGPGAFRMSHTIGVGGYGGGLRVLVLLFAVRRSEVSFVICDECGVVW